MLAGYYIDIPIIYSNILNNETTHPSPLALNEPPGNHSLE